MQYNQWKKVIKLISQDKLIYLESNLNEDGFAVMELISEKEDCFVLKAIRRKSDVQVALKIWIDQINSYERAQKEKQILDKLSQSKNVVKCHDLIKYIQQNATVLVLEYCETSLSNEFQVNKTFTIDEIASFIFQMSNVLVEMEFSQVIHYNIKPSNILKTQGNIYKLCDFTNLFDFNVQQKRNNSQINDSSFLYVSPEQYSHINNQAYTPLNFKMNLYSFSLLFVQIFGFQLDETQALKIRNGNIDDLLNVSSQQCQQFFKILCQYCLCQNPVKRIESYELSILLLKQLNKSNSLCHQCLDILDDFLKVNKAEKNNRTYFIANWKINLNYLKIHLLSKIQILDDNILAQIYKELGKQYSLLKKYTISIINYKRSKRIFEKNYQQQTQDYVDILCLMSESYEQIKNYNMPKALYNEAYYLAEKLPKKDYSYISKINYNLAWIYYHEKEYQKSLDCCNQSIKNLSSSKNEDNIDEADCLDLIGFIYYDMNKISESLDVKIKCLRIREQYGNKRQNAYLHFSIGKIYEKQQNYHNALSEYLYSQQGFNQLLENSNQQQLLCEQAIKRLKNIINKN